MVQQALDRIPGRRSERVDGVPGPGWAPQCPSAVCTRGSRMRAAGEACSARSEAWGCGGPLGLPRWACGLAGPWEQVRPVWPACVTSPVWTRRLGGSSPRPAGLGVGCPGHPAELVLLTWTPAGSRSRSAPELVATPSRGHGGPCREDRTVFGDCLGTKAPQQGQGFWEGVFLAIGSLCAEE